MSQPARVDGRELALLGWLCAVISLVSSGPYGFAVAEPPRVNGGELPRLDGLRFVAPRAPIHALDLAAGVSDHALFPAAVDRLQLPPVGFVLGTGRLVRAVAVRLGVALRLASMW